MADSQENILPNKSCPNAWGGHEGRAISRQGAKPVWFTPACIAVVRRNLKAGWSGAQRPTAARNCFLHHQMEKLHWKNYIQSYWGFAAWIFNYKTGDTLISLKSWAQQQIPEPNSRIEDPRLRHPGSNDSRSAFGRLALARAVWRKQTEILQRQDKEGLAGSPAQRVP